MFASRESGAFSFANKKPLLCGASRLPRQESGEAQGGGFMFGDVMRKTRDIVERFMEKVRKTETCWLWTGHRPHGYGRFYYHGKKETASRIAYLLFIGPIPKGLGVLHTCDVTACVNPDHLYVGTQHDNNLDALRRGRWRTKKGGLPISPEKIREIRELYKRGEFGYIRTAQVIGVHPKVVQHVINRKLWIDF